MEQETGFWLWFNRVNTLTGFFLIFSIGFLFASFANVLFFKMVIDQVDVRLDRATICAPYTGQ